MKTLLFEILQRETNWSGFDVKDVFYVAGLQVFHISVSWITNVILFLFFF